MKFASRIVREEAATWQPEIVQNGWETEQNMDVQTKNGGHWVAPEEFLEQPNVSLQSQ